MGRPNSKTFTDLAGDDWPIKINYHTLRVVKDETDVDLAEITRGKFGVLQDVVNDLDTLGRVLWTLCRAQAEGRGLDERGFAERLDLDILGDAAEALLRGLIDFFPQRVRTQLRAALDLVQTKWNARVTVEEELATQRLHSPETAALIDDLLDSAFSNSAVNSPASPASTPTPSPSGN